MKRAKRSRYGKRVPFGALLDRLRRALADGSLVVTFRPWSPDEIARLDG